MCIINSLNDFKEKIIKKVKTDKECKDYVIPDINPAVYLIDEEFLIRIKYQPVFHPINSFFEMHCYGLTIKKEEDMEGYIFNEKNKDLKLNERDIIIFKYKDSTKDQIFSALTHELMHSLFYGIDNTSDEGNGYNEACTDYLAKKYYGEDYFTSYLELKDRGGYLVYYDNFFNSDKDFKEEILKEYYSKR
ncbi:hypothetical protein SAMN05216455_103104 [Segatella bryantii]|uniref:hypothetical protein n=1 Tax=Segatella bryantii TaxID=77095 RepID=UPI000898B2B5|nr:hypothetical protein [Segatella bryantii]SEA08285.1 hypothetical protein SAMN05216455_103104 [Segatella bryantii]